MGGGSGRRRDGEEERWKMMEERKVGDDSRSTICLC